MINFNVKLAGCNIAISSLFETTKFFLNDYLTEDPPDFSVVITREDIDYDREFLKNNDNSTFSDSYMEKLALHRKVTEEMINYDTILVHGSAIAMDNKAYIFTARSGTGKSTHSRIWRQQFGDRAIMVNDDKPFIKVKEGNVTVYGSPWNGKHSLDSNIAVPLKALCILTRGETNKIDAVSKKEAYPNLIPRVYFSQDISKASKTLKIFDQLLSNVDLYKLSCNMEPQAAVVSYNAMK